MDQALPEITVEYKATSSRVGLMLMFGLAPIWLVWDPWVISWVGAAVLKTMDDAALCSLLVFFALLFLVCVFTVFVCMQNKFVITSKGVRFPLRCLFELHWRLDRKWTELSSIEFRSDGELSTRPAEMVLVFGGSSTLPLELQAFTKEDLQNFLLAMEAYRPQLPVFPDRAKVELGISNTTSSRIAGGESFTKLWEQDLNSRFGSTIFVPLEPGQTLQKGTLKIVGQIAFGGLSAIYLAKRDNKLTVLKEAVVPASADETSRAKAMELFDREAKILMGLNHKRIARVFDNFVEDGRHYLLLEYIEGKDLRKFVKENGPQKEAMVRRWAAEILEVLIYLHGLEPPVLHRDLTPDNLVLERDGSVTVIDFGAANLFLGTATGTLVGKQSYISPEQFRGKASPQSDLYSLGATLYFLLTGQDPEALAVARPRQLNADVSVYLDDFVASLTEMDSFDRPESAASALARLNSQNASREGVH